MISEEPTRDNIKKLIEKIPANSSAIEKVILCSDGTVQTLLSVIFGVPVKVEVLSQSETDAYIARWSRLVAEFSPDNKVVVCLAQSVINKNTKYFGFLDGIREKQIGIGQLISSIGINTKRKITDMYSDDNVFARIYSITSIEPDIELSTLDNLSIIITETFIKSAYSINELDEFDWLAKEESDWLEKARTKA